MNWFCLFVYFLLVNMVGSKLPHDGQINKLFTYILIVDRIFWKYKELWHVLKNYGKFYTTSLDKFEKKEDELWRTCKIKRFTHTQHDEMVIMYRVIRTTAQKHNWNKFIKWFWIRAGSHIFLYIYILWAKLFQSLEFTLFK